MGIKIFDNIMHCLRRALAFILKMLPDRMLLSLRKDLRMIRKMDYPRKDIYIAVDSKIEYDYRANSCGKEPELVDWIERNFTENCVFYDVGANIGAYSFVAAACFEKKINIFAFEPNYINFSKLCENIVLNKYSKCIIPLQVALSLESGVKVFNYNNLEPGGALHSLGLPVDDKGNEYDPVFEQRLLSYSCDDIVAKFNMPDPDFVKIDVDGIELDILKGASEVLGRKNVKSIFIEINAESVNKDEINRFLSSKGYIKSAEFVHQYKGKPLSSNAVYARDR
jgi:FkbM family methyltransferase